MDDYLLAGSAQDIPLYDCRPYHTQKEIEDAGEVNVVLGVVFIIYGIVAELCYVLAMMAMLKKDLLRLSCYKIMIVLGIYDMLAIGVNSLLTGYLWLVGGWYCTNPDLIYISGSIGLGLWCGACMNCFVLVLNRLLDLWKPHIMEFWFKGHRTYLVLMLPLFYSIYFIIWTPPLLFNSQMTAWFFSPFISDKIEETYFNYPHTANNLLIVVGTCVLYSFVVVVLMKKFNQAKMGQTRKINGNQISIIIQSTAICMANLIAALVYVYMQFFPTAKWMILIGHVCWQAGHGIPAFVYLMINKTIQYELKRIFCRRAEVAVAGTAIGGDSSRTAPGSGIKRTATVESFAI